MKKAVLILASVVSAAAFAADPLPPPVPTEDSPEAHLVFKVDFSNGINAAAARGSAKPRLQAKLETVPGVLSGKAVRNAEGVKESTLRYEMTGNLDITQPGTLTFWAKIEDPEKLPKGDLCLFLTEYSPKGYLPFQGNYRKDGKWGMALYFIGFSGMGQRAAGCAVDWKAGEWGQWGIAWDGLEYRIYFNGELKKSLMLPRKPQMEELNKAFTFPIYRGMVLGEIRIYDDMLTEEQMKQLGTDGSAK